MQSHTKNQDKDSRRNNEVEAVAQSRRMKIWIPSAWKTKEGIKIPAEEQKEFITTIHEDEGHSGWERTRLRLKRERIQEISLLHKVFKQVKRQWQNYL